MKEYICNLFALASSNIAISCFVTVLFFVAISLIAYKIHNGNITFKLEKVKVKSNDEYKRIREEQEQLYRK